MTIERFIGPDGQRIDLTEMLTSDNPHARIEGRAIAA